MLNHKAHDKRAGRGADGSHQRPPAELLCALFWLAQFRNDATADTNRRGDKNGSEHTSSHLCSIRGAEHTTDIANHASEHGQQHDGISAVDGAQWFPEEGTDSQEQNLNRSEVADFGHVDSVPLGHDVVCRDDACCHEGRHHRMESHHGNLHVLLPFWPVARCVGRRWLLGGAILRHIFEV